ncbi:hypothetical protein [Mycolicibacterium gadium]|uniref:Uncharacterized protein n=1 Tax=Mycolicibacterium gadium TaxID=1794 RepID=A0A7I7WRD8_MYCGU|nr:hypothetical protein [Mycolicibacterium gadium]BBZ19640.1 hypothetical protein MGAD_39750 [Mycolicibacterium gadium]
MSAFLGIGTLDAHQILLEAPTQVMHGKTDVRDPEAFDAVPFLDLLTAYGSPWGSQELEN